MIYRYPSYCDKFRCIADKCKDNCCIGWEIDIDSDTLEYYKTVSGELGKRLDMNISDGCFVLAENERCPFLNERNLCDIILELGEEHICQICTDHPRYYEWFGTVKEGGIGLCCEESARIILREDLALKEKEIPDEDCSDCDEELFRLLLSARDIIIEHLQKDEFPYSVCAMLDFADNLQFNIDNNDLTLPEYKRVTKSETPDIQKMLHFFTTLEPIDISWNPHIKRCSERLHDIPFMQKEHEPYLRRIATYFIFRYFMKGVFDGEILSRVKLAAVSTWIISYLWRCELLEKGSLDFEDMTQTAKFYSKEVEYSEENLDSLVDAFYTEVYFSSKQIMGAFDI